MTHLVVHPRLTCRFVTFFGMDELRLLSVNHLEIIPTVKDRRAVGSLNIAILE